ncbi:MAG: GyrI-like domain-containing protein [Clostridia bacterium]|nr:GyrI-like domain-containing protein [Clostridia bacterium]MBN2882534.1 GyrI-like domain-containing protein [Clostridia bacterium]
MAELIKVYFEDLPELKVIGKTIGVDWQKIGEYNPIPAFWEKCFKEDVFKKLEELDSWIHDPSYVGYMTMNSYTCGMLMKSDCAVPNGFTFDVIKPTKVVIGWIKGEEKDVFMNAHNLTDTVMKKEGFVYNKESGWSMELYNCPRFTNKDKKGNIILDYFIPVKAN